MRAWRYRKFALIILSIFLTFSNTQLVLANISQSSIFNISQSQLELPIVKSGEIPKFHRVVALANGSAEIIAALGYHNILVGRDIASAISSLRNIPIDNPGHNISTELVISQKPDLILVDDSSSPQTAIALFSKVKLRVEKINNVFSYSAISQKEETISKILSTPKALKMLLKTSNYETKNPAHIQVMFLYLRGTAAVYLMGGKGSGADSLIEQCGDIDVGAKILNSPFTPITSEAIAAANPQVFLLMTKGLESVGGIGGLQKLPGIAQTTAGIKGK